MPARRMRHGETRTHGLAAVDVDHNAAVLAVIAPAVKDVALRDASCVSGSALHKGDAIEMTAVFGGQAADEGGLPERPEAVSVRHRGETIEPRVDEQNLSVTVHGDIVRVEIAGEIARLRHVKRIRTVVAARLLIAHCVAKAVNLRAARH